LRWTFDLLVHRWASESLDSDEADRAELGINPRHETTTKSLLKFSTSVFKTESPGRLKQCA
jgi:hypothetical protein